MYIPAGCAGGGVCTERIIISSDRIDVTAFFSSPTQRPTLTLRLVRLICAEAVHQVPHC